VVVEAPQTVEAPVSRKTLEKKEKRSGLLGALFGMVVPVAIRAAQGYAAQYLENWIAQQGATSPFAASGPQQPQGAQAKPGKPGGNWPA
jgi:hypothetical protein